MKTVKAIFAICLIFISAPSFAQAVSSDSLKGLRQQKEAIELSKKINELKIKLAELENELIEKQQDLERSSREAVNAAEGNKKAADDLNEDPQNKKLSNRAGKSGRGAQKSSKSARIATTRVEKIQKDIVSLKNKIDKSESELASMPTGILTN